MTQQSCASFLTGSAVGKIIDRTPATVRLLASLGRLPVAATTSTGVRLYRRDDVLAYLAARDAQRAAREARA